MDKFKEYKKSEKEKINGVTISTACVPDITHEKHEAFQQPEVCCEPEKIPSNPLTLRVKYSKVFSTNSQSRGDYFSGNFVGAEN